MRPGRREKKNKFTPLKNSQGHRDIRKGEGKEKSSPFGGDELEGARHEGKSEFDILRGDDCLHGPRRTPRSEPARHLLQQLPYAINQGLNSPPLLLRVAALHDAGQAPRQAPHHAKAFWK